MLLELDLLLRDGDRAGFDERVEALANQPGGTSADILLARAEVLGNVDGDFQAADELFLTALEEAQDIGTRELAAAGRYALHVDAKVKALSGSLEERVAQLEPLDDWGEELLRELTLDRARAAVAGKHGLLLLGMAQVAPGFRRLDQAIELAPNEREPLLVYATWALQLLEHIESLPDEQRAENARIVDHMHGKLARRLSALVDLVARLETDEDRYLVLNTAFFVAARIQDWQAVVSLSEELRPFVPNADQGEFEDVVVDALREQLDFYDPQ